MHYLNHVFKHLWHPYISPSDRAHRWANSAHESTHTPSAETCGTSQDARANDLTSRDRACCNIYVSAHTDHVDVGWYYWSLSLLFLINNSLIGLSPHLTAPICSQGTGIWTVADPIEYWINKIVNKNLFCQWSIHTQYTTCKSDLIHVVDCI